MTKDSLCITGAVGRIFHKNGKGIYRKEGIVLTPHGIVSVHSQRTMNRVTNKIVSRTRYEFCFDHRHYIGTENFFRSRRSLAIRAHRFAREVMRDAADSLAIDAHRFAQEVIRDAKC